MLGEATIIFENKYLFKILNHKYNKILFTTDCHKFRKFEKLYYNVSASGMEEDFNKRITNLHVVLMISFTYILEEKEIANQHRKHIQMYNYF